jgi:hypothetical protein
MSATALRGDVRPPGGQIAMPAALKVRTVRYRGEVPADSSDDGGCCWSVAAFGCNGARAINPPPPPCCAGAGVMQSFASSR